MATILDPARLPCAAGTVRRASRSLARLYDAQLGRAGLTTTQFSILRSVQRHGGSAPLGDLADELVFERTALYRALSPLVRSKLVSIRPGADRRSKRIVLTAKADRVIAAALPHWVAVQRAIVDRMGSRAWRSLAAELARITTIARATNCE